MTQAQLPFQTHSPTSQQAAQSMKPHAQSQRERVLSALSIIPMSDEQGAAATGLNASSYRPRRIELARDGLIEQNGFTVTNAGRKAVRWQVKEQA